MSGYMQSDYDPFMLAELVGQQYNPYQGYPTKQVSDQVWDVYGPTPDYLIAQMAAAMMPNREEFSVDAFMGADPLLRGPLAEALAYAKGDTIGAYNYLQGSGEDDFQPRLRKEIGRTEWEQIANRGDLRMLGAINSKEKDQAGVDYYNRGLEELLAQGAPSSQRNMAQWDFIAERMGGRPYPGAGQFPGEGGSGRSGGAPDPMADLASARNINLDATPEGTPFGEGIEEVGQAEGPDRLEYEGRNRYAVLGGRVFQLPDTMERPGGELNPEYQRALQAVVSQKRNRTTPRRGIPDRERRGGGQSSYQRRNQGIASGNSPIQRFFDSIF